MTSGYLGTDPNEDIPLHEVDPDAHPTILEELESKYSPENKPTAADVKAVPAASRMDWGTKGVVANVVGLLAWKNYGNAHVIFDASNGTTPDNSPTSNKDAEIPWEFGQPVLMGYQGDRTYGVRVDSARISDILSDYWSAKAIGEPFALATDIVGVVEPPASSNYKYIKLSSNDEYNGNILINEVITGTAPTISVTAEIDFPGSPLHGSRVELRNTSKPFSRPGENTGVVIGDTSRRITGTITNGYGGSGGVAAVTASNGVFTVNTTTPGNLTSPGNTSLIGYNVVELDTALVVPTSDQNQPVHIEEPYFMRIK